MTTVLAIETSCDETAVALLRSTLSSFAGQAVIEVLASKIASQVDVHALTGGVVPEVAAREHINVINALISEVLTKSRITNHKSLDAIAVTVGPGLMPALAIGVQTARTLSYAWNKPIVPVNHLEGHVYSALLNKEEAKGKREKGNHPTTPNSLFHIPHPASAFPALALIVSGGHTMLVKISGHLEYEILGQTRDDAAGEAFDKVARLLELPYPGGPSLSKLAEQGDAQAYNFTRPMQNSGDLDFSFSGLKTEVLYTLRDMEKGVRDKEASNVAASFQQAVVDSLLGKVQKTLEQDNYITLLLAGGVAANKLLRREIMTLAEQQNIDLSIAPLDLCGDNAVMIGQVGLIAFEQKRTAKWQAIDAVARMPITSFS